ncbi:hypothetical protein QEH68_09470 [Paenarthrobacter sp. OM7]|uniref:hypothetical protein n=1 Tax=Paenarthrobacter sp. OM7 TaxID=3041264 RepID=UPI002468410D|nr:hypothetical protein [Paenarthrobacter sp. OM7]WGM22374.1 hypothetical protein QEH68_09470 [Paenarthrobacter sp. OM7]
MKIGNFLPARVELQESQVGRRQVLISLGGAVLVATVSACALLELPDEVEPSDIIGEWTSKPKNGHTTLLKLCADGIFEWSGVTEGTFGDGTSSEKLDWERLVTYSGQWSIKKDLVSKKFTNVRLRPETSQDLAIFPLSVWKRGSDQFLTYTLGDPDGGDRFEFHNR